MTESLRRLVDEKKIEGEAFKEIVLAAPDVDAEVFKQDIAPALVKIGRRVSLYFSPRDGALKLSRWVHEYARAGNTTDGIFSHSRMEAIDAAVIDGKPTGHSYILENAVVISDLLLLLRDAMPAIDRRRMEQESLKTLRWWKFKAS